MTTWEFIWCFVAWGLFALLVVAGMFRDHPACRPEQKHIDVEA